METNTKLHGATIAQWIKGFKSDIRTMDKIGYTPRHKTAIRVHAWNWATSPSRAMTDREHSACSRLAKRIWKELQLPQHLNRWRESDSGMLFI
jgi:hypothetical protein